MQEKHFPVESIFLENSQVRVAPDKDYLGKLTKFTSKSSFILITIKNSYDKAVRPFCCFNKLLVLFIHLIDQSQ